MKEKIRKLTKLIKKYLLDIVIITGVLILSYNILRPPTEYFMYTDYHTGGKMLGILLIVIGINIAIRKYLFSKNKRENYENR